MPGNATTRAVDIRRDAAPSTDDDTGAIQVTQRPFCPPDHTPHIPLAPSGAGNNRSVTADEESRVSSSLGSDAALDQEFCAHRCSRKRCPGAAFSTDFVGYPPVTCAFPANGWSLGTFRRDTDICKFE